MAARTATKATTPGQRARALLRSLLSEAEYKQVITRGYLMMQSPSRPEITYRIPRGPGFVRVYEEKKPLVDLCVQPTAFLPWDDILVMHKLLIESDEAGYLKTANRFTPTTRRPYAIPEMLFRPADLATELLI